jgi:acylphosphatase
VTDATTRRVQGVAEGLVQGVGYRRSMQRQAEESGLAGWVRNLPGGQVEFLAQGESGALDRFLAWARRGPWAARVTEVVVTEQPPAADLTGFVVRPTPLR